MVQARPRTCSCTPAHLGLWHRLVGLSTGWGCCSAQQCQPQHHCATDRTEQRHSDSHEVHAAEACASQRDRKTNTLAFSRGQAACLCGLGVERRLLTCIPGAAESRLFSRDHPTLYPTAKAPWCLCSLQHTGITWMDTTEAVLMSWSLSHTLCPV